MRLGREGTTPGWKACSCSPSTFVSAPEHGCCTVQRQPRSRSIFWYGRCVSLGAQTLACLPRQCVVLLEGWICTVLGTRSVTRNPAAAQCK